MKTIVWKFPNTGDFCGIFPKYPSYLREHSRRFKADINPISTGLFCLVVALGGGGVFHPPP